MQQTTPKSQSALKQYGPILIVLIIAGAGFYSLKDSLSFEALRDNRETLIAFRDANYVLALLCFIAIYALFIAFSVPGALVLTLTGGFLFSTFPGVIFNVTGATLGATGLFLAARWGFGYRLGQKLQNSEGITQKIKQGIDQNQWSMLFLIRLVPAVPFFVANLVPSFLGVPMRRFVISTFFGIMPGALVYTSVGAGLGAVFARGETPNLSILWELQIILPILGLCALSALPIIINTIRGKKGL